MQVTQAFYADRASSLLDLAAWAEKLGFRNDAWQEVICTYVYVQSELNETKIGNEGFGDLGDWELWLAGRFDPETPNPRPPQPRQMQTKKCKIQNGPVEKPQPKNLIPNPQSLTSHP